jgi:hypothetical protein
MATHEDVRRIVAALPGTARDGGSYTVRRGAKDKPLAWPWRERVDPKKARVPNPDVLAVRVTREDKEMLLAADPAVYFTEPHYDGYPAILVRLAAIDPVELEELLTDAWRLQAPPASVRAFDAERGLG